MINYSLTCDQEPLQTIEVKSDCKTLLNLIDDCHYWDWYGLIEEDSGPTPLRLGSQSAYLLDSKNRCL